MHEMTLYPLLLQPSLHTRVWGGRRLATQLGKPLPTDEPYGESWEMHDTAVIANGPLAGMTVGAALGRLGTALCGEGSDPALGMPLLAKILDASDWLSVQVHPDDGFAEALEGQPRGKTEAWYVLAAAPDAKLVIGVQPGTPGDAIAEAVRENRLEGLLEYASVRAGDVFFIPAGTIHAIGPGLLIYEIQQSSDLTYRLYDWGRLGLDGQPRALHIEKSITVARVDVLPQISHVPDDGARVEVVRSPYFVTVQHRLGGAYADAVVNETTGHFHILTCIGGSVQVEQGDTLLALGVGGSALIPAGLASYRLSGEGVVLCSSQA